MLVMYCTTDGYAIKDDDPRCPTPLLELSVQEGQPIYLDIYRRRPTMPDVASIYLRGVVHGWLAAQRTGAARRG